MSNIRGQNLSHRPSLQMAAGIKGTASLDSVDLKYAYSSKRNLKMKNSGSGSINSTPGFPLLKISPDCPCKTNNCKDNEQYSKVTHYQNIH